MCAAVYWTVDCEQAREGVKLSENPNAIKWVAIESVQRTLEKSTRSYNKVLLSGTIIRLFVMHGHPIPCYLLSTSYRKLVIVLVIQKAL
jgi:hypothetical protein